MFRLRSICLITLIAFGSLTVPSEAEAGPLLDWLRGNRQRCRLFQPKNTGCNTCQTGLNAPAMAQANPWNLQPGQCATTCNQTCARTVVNYVPYTAYRCSWEQVPVTQYKPVTNSDPCTGCSVTCMKPCTSYSWQMKQVPYTTYRAVYRQENYTVPVTTISNSGECNTCGVPATLGVAGCPTCNVPGATGPMPAVPGSTMPGNAAPIYGTPQPGATYPYPAQGNVLPGTTTYAPGPTINTDGSFSSPAVPTPADLPPTLNANPQTLQRPFLDGLRGMNDNSQLNPVRNAILPGGVTLEQTGTGRSALRRDWGYSPVRLASHTSPVADSNDQAETQWTWAAHVPAAPASVEPPAASSPKVNSSWRSGGW